MRISDWSSDVCSSDLHLVAGAVVLVPVGEVLQFRLLQRAGDALGGHIDPAGRSCSVRKRSGCVVITRVVNPEPYSAISRSEEHTSELQSLMRISYAVFCLKKKNMSTK